ncbi:MAG: cobalamin-dependent protein, partial [Planctomycetes bacterium]|nr:cobalamin-dependent protein [Planctomycetota bacterium]
MKMLTLINTNRMSPPVGPLGIEYVAGAARAAGIPTDVLDLCLVDDADAAIDEHFRRHEPVLVGLSFRNADDCFWPSCQSFLPDLAAVVTAVRRRSDAPIVLGGVGFSIFAERIVSLLAADFGVRGDGEGAIVELVSQLTGRRRFERVEGLIWRADGA